MLMLVFEKHLLDVSFVVYDGIQLIQLEPSLFWWLIVVMCLSCYGELWRCNIN